MIECDNNEEFIIANLSSSVFNETLDLAFNEGEKICFKVRGPGTVHLTGNLMDEDNLSPSGEDFSMLAGSDSEMESEEAKKEKDKRRRIEAKEVSKTAPDQRGEKAEDDDLKHFEQVLQEGDVAFAKGQMLRSRELHTKALSLAPQAWRSSIQCFATRYQLARSCIEMANPNSLA